jgi:hypothetical protein
MNMMSMTSFLSTSKDLSLGAQAVSLKFQHVPGRKKRDLIVALGNTGGGSRVDDVARFQHHELTDVPNEVFDAEHHIGGSAILSFNAIDRKPQSNVLRIWDFVGRKQPRTTRIECCTALSFVPRATAFQLKRPLGNVI